MFNILLAFSIFLIFVAEALNIAGEMLAAQSSGRTLWSIGNWKLFLMVTIGSWLLLFAYSIGYQHTKNIWIISATAVTSILIIEPVLAYFFFAQLPTKGALLGLILGALGLFLAIFWK